MKMKKTVSNNKDAAPPVVGRRSLRNVRPAEEDAKHGDTTKKRKISFKKDEIKKDDSRKDESKKDDPKKDSQRDQTEPEMKEEVKPEISVVIQKPSGVRNLKGGKKRQITETPEDEEDEDIDPNTSKDERKDTNISKDENKESTEEFKERDKTEKKKNGKAENGKKSRGRKRRKPVAKDVEPIEEEEVWTPLEALEGDSGSKREMQKRNQSKNDRRKQSLVERDGAAEVMLQTRPVPVRHQNTGDVSDCEVLESAPQPQPKKVGPIETVDIDDDQSEEGSNFCEIVAEPDKDSTFDFKRLLIQSRLVNLPSSLWGEHRDPRGHFVSFTRFNPDHPDNNSILVDRAVVFEDSLHPQVFVNGKKVELPEMFHVVETLLEVSQVIQFANNTVTPFIPVPAILGET